jgi:leucine-zipper-like transcriptional regulator 1
MGNKLDSPNFEDLCVLNDVRIFDLTTKRWLPASSTNSVVPDHVPDSLIPKPRYAHLSSVTSDRLFVVGGQDLSNVWLDDIHVYDLIGKAWVQRRDYPRHCGTYRSVAVSAELCVRTAVDSQRSRESLGPPGARFRLDNTQAATADVTTPDKLIHLPYSTPPTEDEPSDIYLYSNYNVRIFSCTLWKLSFNFHF